MPTTDPRARQLAETVHGLARQKATTLPAWPDLSLSEREKVTAEARLWLRGAVAAGLVPVVSSPPATDRATLRDRVAEALYRREWPLKQVWQQALPADRSRYEALADAVLAVLPPPADRAAVLLEVADWLKAWRPEFFERWAVVEQDRYEGGVDDAAAELCRMATEAPTPETQTALMRAHVALAEQAGRDQAALERVRTVLETEAVVGRSALEYRGMITSALMAVGAPQAECACDPAPHREEDGTYSHWAGCPIADAEQAAVGARQPDTETQDGIVRCAAAVLKRHHGPHRWAPQPGMERVRCPGACNCPHPEDEHSVYGCADGCACEYLPPPRRAGGAGGVADETGEGVAPVHAVPLPGSNGISACCGRPPCEFVGERVTRDLDAVTCPGPAAETGQQ